MECGMCDNPNELKAEIIPTYKYKACGLDNVILHGVKVSRCEKCGEEYYNYGNLEDLHKQIANFLILKDSLLSDKEVKFLRKYLGYSGAMFAELIGITGEHLSRLENGRVITAPLDRLIRTFVAERIPDRNYILQDLILEKKLIHMDRMEFSYKKNQWVADKVAA